MGVVEMVTSGKAYQSTEVPIDKSQGEIRRMLRSHGAEGFSFGELRTAGREWGRVEFAHNDHLVRIQVPLKLAAEAIAADKRHVSAADKAAGAAEREAARIWRVLYWSIKARLEAVAEEVESFEEAFLSHLVDPATNQTLWETVQPSVAEGRLRIGAEGLFSGPLAIGPARG